MRANKPVKPVKMTVTLETEDRKVTFEIPKGFNFDFTVIAPFLTADIHHFDSSATIERDEVPRLLFLITPTPVPPTHEQYRMTVVPPPEPGEEWWPL